MCNAARSEAPPVNRQLSVKSNNKWVSCLNTKKSYFCFVGDLNLTWFRSRRAACEKRTTSVMVLATTVLASSAVIIAGTASSFICRNGRLRGGSIASKVEDRSSWQGPFTFPDGATYFGETCDGRICGEGEWNSAKGERYVGSFVDDVFHGDGVYTDGAGNQFTGSFSGGIMHGSGTYVHADGRADVSGYTNGADQGMGARWSPDRTQAWRLHDGLAVALRDGGTFDVTEDQISLAEAEAIAESLGLSVPPSIFEVSADGAARMLERRRGTGTVQDQQNSLSRIDSRLAGTSLDGKHTGFLVAHSAAPVVPSHVCDAIVSECEARAARNGGWTTKRHTNYPTTDVPLQTLPTSLEWLRSVLLPDIAWPFLADAFAFALPSKAERSGALPEEMFRVSE